MSFDPRTLDLTGLFADPGMFDSRRAWRRAGFDVRDPAKDSECMVAAHPSAPGYLFKKYPDDVSQRAQRENFAARIEGARRVAEIVHHNNLVHVTAPKKYVHALPRDFGKHAQVLVVQWLDVVGTDESERRYHEISEPVLRDLLRVLVELPGLDSNSKNVQFTRTGQVAFVDLENWNNPHRREVTLKSIGNYLSRDGRRIARRILEESD